MVNLESQPEQPHQAPYRAHDGVKTVEVGEIEQRKSEKIVGADRKSYALEPGRYAVVADQDRDGNLRSAVIRYIVADRETGERRAALSTVSSEVLRSLVRDGSIRLHAGFSVQTADEKRQMVDLQRAVAKRDADVLAEHIGVGVARDPNGSTITPKVSMRR